LSEGYRPRAIYESNPFLRQVIDGIASGQFSRGDRNLFRPLLDQLLEHDPYLLFADYQSYVDCQDRVDATYRDEKRWNKMAILNAARMGKFSSDRSIREYSEKIWQVGAITLC
jgi:starch phosphorylase